MKRKLIGLALLASGCGNNLSAPSPLARVQGACGDVLYESEIDAMVSGIQASRDDGYSYSDNINAAYYGCEDGCWFDSECTMWCVSCATAVIDYVYGR